METQDTSAPPPAAFRIGVIVDIGTVNTKLCWYSLSVQRPLPASDIHAVEFNGRLSASSSIIIDTDSMQIWSGLCAEKGILKGVSPEKIVEHIKLALLLHRNGVLKKIDGSFQNMAMCARYQIMSLMPPCSADFMQAIWWIVSNMFRNAMNYALQECNYQRSADDAWVEELCICLPQTFKEMDAFVIANNFMSEGYKIEVAPELECAAALYFSLPGTLTAIGQKTMLLDCGAGTVDWVVFETLTSAPPGQAPKLRALCKGSRACGSATVNEKMKDLLFPERHHWSNKRPWALTQAASKAGLDYASFIRQLNAQIEYIKVNFNTRNHLLRLKIGGFTHKFDWNDVNGIFRSAAEEISSVILSHCWKALLNGAGTQHIRPDLVVMARGFSESSCLRHNLHELVRRKSAGQQCPRVAEENPEMWNAVARGAGMRYRGSVLGECAHPRRLQRCRQHRQIFRQRR